MTSYLISMGIAVVAVMGWVAVQQASRAFHARHPEALPSLESMGGCHHCSQAGHCGHAERGDCDESGT